MSANQAQFPIAAMARVLGVSTTGYYAWRSRPPCARSIADDALLKRVRTIHAVSRGTHTCDLTRILWTRVTAYAAAASCSFCIGVIYPIAECKRLQL